MCLGRVVGNTSFAGLRLFAVSPAANRKAFICDGFAFLRHAFCTAIDASKEVVFWRKPIAGKMDPKWIAKVCVGFSANPPGRGWGEPILDDFWLP
jgi:hypothetical protein